MNQDQSIKSDGNKSIGNAFEMKKKKKEMSKKFC